MRLPPRLPLPITPSFAEASRDRAGSKDLEFFRDEGNTLLRVDEFELVRTDDLEIFGFLKRFGRRFGAVEPELGHPVVSARNAEGHGVADQMALHVFPDMAGKFGDAPDQRAVMVPPVGVELFVAAADTDRGEVIVSPRNPW